jgi:hypothetical protein
MISAVFIIGMIYFYHKTDKSDYKAKLSPDLQKRYDKITRERMLISFQGYVAGVILSLLIIFYRGIKNPYSLVCTVMATCFLTNYLYYMLHPKSDWVLNHVETKEEVKAWLQMYREMQYNYHTGLALGIIAVGVFAFAFR